jgi:hypothetical protein
LPHGGYYYSVPNLLDNGFQRTLEHYKNIRELSSGMCPLIWGKGIVIRYNVPSYKNSRGDAEARRRGELNEKRISDPDRTIDAHV